MLCFKGLNCRICIPVFPVYLVTPYVKVFIREYLGHFAQKRIQKSVKLLASGVHARIVDSPKALDLVGAGGAGEFGICCKPGGGMARHVKFRNYANASITRIGNNFAHFPLGVEFSIRGFSLELRESIGLSAESLVV